MMTPRRPNRPRSANHTPRQEGILLVSHSPRLLVSDKEIEPVRCLYLHRTGSIHRWQGQASEWLIPRDGDAMHDSRLRRIVVDREMLRAPVVPEDQRSCLPAEPAGELRAGRVLLEIVD